MKIKKLCAILLVLVMVISITACSKTTKQENEKLELIVFAAASMTETLSELGNRYMAANENINIRFNFDSSGALKTQIQEGAECDIFISAGLKQMDQIDISANASVNTESLDYVMTGSRFNILENKLALIVPENNPAGITSYADLAKGLKTGSIVLAIGNSDVPAGQYSQKILAYLGLGEDELVEKGCVTYASNVKEITTQVSEAVVDCGIVYQTDAFSAGLDVVDTATVEMCGQVIYPAAVMKASSKTDAAKSFLEYLTGDEADSVFENIGFTPVE